MADYTVFCRSCGGKQFRKPDDPKPDDTVTCLGCGKTLTWRDLKAQAAEQIKRDLLGKLRK